MVGYTWAMKPKTASTLRQLPYVVVGFALLLIAAFAVQQTLLLRNDLADQQARQASQTLQGMVNYWESAVMRQSRVWLDELENSTNIAETELRMQRAAPWFDAIYIWEPAPQYRLRYPTAATVEDPVRLAQHPCIARATNALRFLPINTAITAYRDCRATPPRYNLYTSSMAAALLLQQHRHQEAWEALNEVRVSLNTPLRDAAREGLPLPRIINRRIQAANALGGMGQVDAQQQLLLLTVRELTDLDARQLDELDAFLEYTLPHELQQANAPQAMGHLKKPIARAKRRVDAYRDIVQRLISRPPPDRKEGIQITLDPYDQRGFLLVYSTIANGQLVAALQLDPLRLLEELPHTPDLPARIILDANGQPLDGTALSPEDIWVQVPFGRLLPHLRLALRHPNAPVREQHMWLLSQLAPVMLTVLLGGLAIWARMRADRRREELYERQRDFITRVTHELKTPLAGIRIMAETLEMISEDSEQHTFVDRILQETDRLTERIDDVLRLTRTPTPPRKTKLAVTEFMAELSTEWQPRFAAVDGVLTFESPRDPPSIKADAALLQDALNNLLSNSLKYRHATRPLSCTVTLTYTARSVAFAIADNGIGVPENMQSAIFDRFTRVEGPNRGMAGGHGLGLSFVHDTAQAHGGSVTCESGPDGIGTQFTLSIPR